MNDNFLLLKALIDNRHTTKLALMNGGQLNNTIVQQLLELADRAPTHARTEPWRFVVFSGESLQQFCFDHANLYWNNTDAGSRTEDKFEKLKNQYTTVSHLIITIMKRTLNAKIPADEEYAAVCAAMQNMLLGCQALNVAAIWSTGGMAHHDAMKNYLGIHDEDKVIGLLFLGRSTEAYTPTIRKISLAEKTMWK